MYGGVLHGRHISLHTRQLFFSAVCRSRCICAENPPFISISILIYNPFFVFSIETEKKSVFKHLK